MPSHSRAQNTPALLNEKIKNLVDLGTPEPEAYEQVFAYIKDETHILLSKIIATQNPSGKLVAKRYTDFLLEHQKHVSSYSFKLVAMELAKFQIAAISYSHSEEGRRNTAYQLRRILDSFPKEHILDSLNDLEVFIYRLPVSKKSTHDKAIDIFLERCSPVLAMIRGERMVFQATIPKLGESSTSNFLERFLRRT